MGTVSAAVPFAVASPVSTATLPAAVTLQRICAALPEAENAYFFDRRTACLASVKTEDATETYAETCMLLGTPAHTARLISPDRIGDFVDCLKRREPNGAAISTRQPKTGCKLAIQAGGHTFKLRDGGKVPARCTDTSDLKNRQWFFDPDQSSPMPENGTGQAKEPVFEECRIAW